MSRRVALPDENYARRTMDELIRSARGEGKRPTVIALARQLGMSHTTFWRHFPDIAKELVAVARGIEPESSEPAPTSRYDQLADAHAKLKRAHADTEHNLELAKATIQRLSLDNHHLRQHLEGATNVVPINKKRPDSNNSHD